MWHCKEAVHRNLPRGPRCYWNRAGDAVRQGRHALDVSLSTTESRAVPLAAAPTTASSTARSVGAVSVKHCRMHGRQESAGTGGHSPDTVRVATPQCSAKSCMSNTDA